jgi:hypothetical protein
MTFRQFIHLLAEKIGLHQIPVIDGATEFRHFLSADGVHHELITSVVRNVYKKNGCGHLDAKIDPEKTRHVIGATRASLLTEEDTDICRYRLVNQLCECTDEILSSREKESSQKSAAI